MKAVVVYRSRGGFTKQYAEMIAQELAAGLFEGSSITLADLLTYDTIIYGGGLYASGINGLGLITKNLTKLAGRKLIVFATGASPGRPEELAAVTAANFTKEQLQQIHFFYLRGGFDQSKLSPYFRLLMSLLKVKLLWRGLRGIKQSPDERGMLNAYRRPVNFVNRSKIAPLIACAHEPKQEWR